MHNFIKCFAFSEEIPKLIKFTLLFLVDLSFLVDDLLNEYVL